MYTPSREYADDYGYNVLIGELSELERLWKEEYKPVLMRMTTPGKVYEDSRLARIIDDPYSDSIDSIETEAFMDGVRRIPVYEGVIIEMLLMFVSRIRSFTEMAFFNVMSERGFSGNSFSFGKFIRFSGKLNPDCRLDSLKGFDTYDLVRRIDNLVKHNSMKAYSELRRGYPEHVVDDGEFRSGSYSPDWIDLGDTTVEDILRGIREFMGSYAESFLGEDPGRAVWDSDGYFRYVFSEVGDLREYLGLP